MFFFCAGLGYSFVTKLKIKLNFLRLFVDNFTFVWYYYYRNKGKGFLNRGCPIPKLLIIVFHKEEEIMLKLEEKGFVDGVVTGIDFRKVIKMEGMFGLTRVKLTENDNEELVASDVYFSAELGSISDALVTVNSENVLTIDVPQLTLVKLGFLDDVKEMQQRGIKSIEVRGQLLNFFKGDELSVDAHFVVPEHIFLANVGGVLGAFFSKFSWFDADLGQVVDGYTSLFESATLKANID